MKPWATIQKQLGETPLEAAERLRKNLHLPSSVPLAYAGRLDPMATGKLLILIGDECKKQQAYHHLDKAYTFEILFGTMSDTGDVLGLTEYIHSPIFEKKAIWSVLKKYTGAVSLPYPHFSSKTVRGKPLHVWTLEGRLNEIEIPMRDSYVYRLQLLNTHTMSRDEIYETALRKIASVTPVTDPRKALGEDFRRDKVRTAWATWKATTSRDQTFQIVTISCIASSGTYMRTLAEQISNDLGTHGIAWSIDRTIIGTYKPLTKHFGFWTKKF